MKTFACGLLLFAVTICLADEGHSSHGSAFDSGMRTKPWLIQGVGDSPFAITSKNKEVQKWFDQGNALLHSFWFEEAERSFRWCLKLDPDCAMAYWGLARCGFTWFNLDWAPQSDDKKYDRYKVFLKEAVKRKESVSPKERMFIEALHKAVAKGGSRVFVENLKEIITKFPEDIEAKSLAALFSIDKDPADKNELVIQQVLKVNPMHPGALHASIHNWDYAKPQNALKACELYGKAAPGVGHALHMPGHIYSKIGMWHEAAIAMDSATRIELKYMNDRLALPFETWNYPHNRNYLCYIQEQLGLADAAIQGAKDIIAAPRDPERNDPDQRGMIMQGLEALVRSSIKFEKWNDILTPGYIEWFAKDEESQFVKAWAETLAYSGLKQPEKARVSLKILQDVDRKRRGDKGPSKDLNIAEAFVYAAEGNADQAQKALLRADTQDKEYRQFGAGDPPFESWSVARLLGDHFRAKNFNDTAITYYERALQYEPNDAFSLSGLAQAYNAKGDKKTASKYAGRLAYVWSSADPSLRWMEEVKKLQLDMTPVAETPSKERVYVPAQLDGLGPSNWQPFKAPKFEVLNYNGKSVHLEDYRGKNILLVFFLGEACVHCVGQLKSINDRLADFQAQKTEVLAVCSATPQSLKESVKLNPVKVRFLSDTNHENARRFASYDDFEEMELHSTILIDKQGKIRWKRTGGDPFMNMDFLIKELKRINQ